MASITQDNHGRRKIQFVAVDGRRRTLYMGRSPLRVVQAVKLKVEAIVSAAHAKRPPDDETSRWLQSLDAVMVGKLAAVGLIEKRGALLLGPYLAAYVARRGDVKPATLLVMGHVTRNLIDYFGKDKDIRELTEGDADAWRLWLVTHEQLAQATVSKRAGTAKQFLRPAARSKLIPANPFDDIRRGSQANDARQFFVTREMSAKVIDKCPDAEWKLLFALCRYGGLRCPSEPLGLKWAEVDWETSRFLVHSPKTERHAGGESRWCPIFPELLPFLRDAFERAEPGADHVVAKWRDTNANLRTTLKKVIKRAGLTPWPRLFQNLRGTRETELLEEFPIQVVTAWIGNSEKVARRHYLQVTEDHFAKAVKPREVAPSTDDARATHETTQHPPAQAGTGEQMKPARLGDHADLPAYAGVCSPVLGGENPNSGLGGTRTHTL